MLPKLLFIFSISVFFISYANAQTTIDIEIVQPGIKYNSVPSNGIEILSVYCYKGIPKQIFHFWRTVRFDLHITGGDWDLYIGGTSKTVKEEYAAKTSFWELSSFFSKKSDTLYLDPFNRTCVGVYTSTDHSVDIHIRKIDFWRFFMFLIGFAVFFSAPKISSNPIFYYSCGISLGVSMSFLVIIYVTSRFIPKRSAVLGFVAGGWAIGVYLINLIYSNLRTIAHQYKHYVLAYLTSAAFISFAICYRYGPVSNPRTISLIRWFLKGVGIVLMFCSSSFQEASMGVIIILLVYDNFPRTLLLAVTRFWRSKFPTNGKLLTEDEYHEQGARETIKALDELRNYCSSPECNQWKTVLKLHSPIRFAGFMEGQSHLSDSELMEYESDISKPAIFTDDSDSDNGS